MYHRVFLILAALASTLAGGPESDEPKEHNGAVALIRRGLLSNESVSPHATLLQFGDYPCNPDYYTIKGHRLTGGRQLKSFKAKSLNDCGNKCKYASYDCRTFNYKKTNKECRHYSSRYYELNTMIDDRFYYGYLDCPKSGTCQEWEWGKTKGYKFVGNRDFIFSFNALSIGQCANNCLANYDCFTFNYRKRDKKCSLYRKKLHELSAEPDSAYYFGYVTCPRYGYCEDVATSSYEGYRISGAQIRSFGVNSLYECQLACEGTINCNGYSYLKGDSVCKLYEGDDLFFEQDGLYYGGEVYCPKSTWCPNPAIGTSKYTIFNSARTKIRSFPTYSLDYCAVICQGSYDCYTFEYYRASKYCVLYRETYDQLSTYYDSGLGDYYTGSLYC